MYLRTLQLHGFKSFAEKTTLQFDPGVTAIVGPNGCGKSNVIDAVRWVLGEQRARLLRSDKMESVIFNGTSKRRALGLAEVTLTIENTRGVLPTAYSEVTVARRLFRSGDSEYLLNGTVCRLKDILDLFMDTGLGAGAYSVIELKMIEDILSDNAADRRRLFEEAAGVTKYKQRRAQALRKLGGTQADLTRLRDLTDEIEKTVRRLARQAKKAERYHALAERLRDLEVTLFAHDYTRLAAERATVMKEAMQLRAEVERQNAALARGEAEVEQARTALIQAEQALSEHQQAQFAHTERLREAEAEQRLAAERAQSAKTTLTRLATEAEADAKRQAAFDREKTALVEQQADADQQRATTDRAAADAQARAEQTRRDADAQRSVLRDAQQTTQSATRRVQQAQADLTRLRDRRALRQAEAERLDAERTEIEAQQATLDGDLDAAAAAVTEAQAALDEAQDAQTQAEAERDRLDGALGEARETLREAQQTAAALHTERDLLRSLLDTRDDLDAPSASLLETTDWAEAPPQTVADLFACDEADRLALDAALGTWADALVVQTEAEATAGIAQLRDTDQGRARFFILDRLPDRPSRERSPTPPGTTPAREAVRTRDPLRPLAQLLFQNVFIADTLDEAEALRAQYPIATIVTRAGEWTNARGAYAGGPEKPRAAALRLGRRERLDKIETALPEADARIETLRAAVARMQAERDALGLAERQQATREARQALAAAEQVRTRHEAARQGLDTRLGRLATRRAALEGELAAEAEEATLEAELEDAQADFDQAQAALSNAEEATLAADARQRTTQHDAADARLAAAEARNAADNLHRDAERIDRALADLQARARQRATQHAEATQRRKEAQAQQVELAHTIEALRTEAVALTSAVTAADLALLRARSAANEREDALRTTRRAREEALQALNRRDLRLTEVQTRQATLAERAASEYGLAAADLADRPTPPHLLTGEPSSEDAEDASPSGTSSGGTSSGAASKPTASPRFDAEAARAEIPTLREKIRGLGAVNALALEEYEEEQTRLEQLVQQRDDLERAESTLLSTIEEINATAAARFTATFEQVQAQFQRLFNTLFGGDAKASLSLDGADPLEAAIEINARPRGKKPSVLAQLSGGEKTLTAIALLFAIYLVKPSPFCILDEVDAPLDDANIGRFMTLLRSFAESTQFILVTHNKLTMEAADRMYGITMQEAGVSKLVGVRFDEVVDEERIAA